MKNIKVQYLGFVFVEVRWTNNKGESIGLPMWQDHYKGWHTLGIYFKYVKTPKGKTYQASCLLPARYTPGAKVMRALGETA